MINTLNILTRAAKGWRTMLLSGALGLGGLLQSADWATVVGPEQTGPVMLALAVVVAALRAVTDGPVGRR